jgi:hypothetical protein
MPLIRRSCSVTVPMLLVVALLSMLSTPTFANDGSAAMPENAHANQYGHGWECNHGYKEKDNTCQFIKIPDNAYLSAYGDRWECNRGYRVSGQGCVAIKVPVHGYLVESSYGPGWKCVRGFREVGKECVAVQVPKNAHIGFIGNDWECNKPYRRAMTKCELN